MAWKPGPLPPDTWGWGGVVPVGEASGFYFADFKGDHVFVPEAGPNLSDRTLRSEQVALYDNSLELPTHSFGDSAMTKTPAQPYEAIDWAALWAKVSPAAVPFLRMLLLLLSGEPAPMMAAPVKCGPGGCNDLCQCQDAAIAAQVQALACQLQCKCCPPAPPPAP